MGLLSGSYGQRRQQVTENDAIQAALCCIGNKNNSTSNIALHHLTNYNGDTLLYEITFDGVSVLLSGSKACIPVLGTYKSEVSLLEYYDFLPCNIKSFIGDYISQIDSCFNNGIIPNTSFVFSNPTIQGIESFYDNVNECRSAFVVLKKEAL